MKKFTAVSLFAAMLLSVSACSGANTPPADTAETTATAATSETSAAAGETTAPAESSTTTTTTEATTATTEATTATTEATTATTEATTATTEATTATTEVTTAATEVTTATTEATTATTEAAPATTEVTTATTEATTTAAPETTTTAAPVTAAVTTVPSPARTWEITGERAASEEYEAYDDYDYSEEGISFDAVAEEEYAFDLADMKSEDRAVAEAEPSAVAGESYDEDYYYADEDYGDYDSLSEDYAEDYFDDYCDDDYYGGCYEPSQARAGLLTAGEWCDNDDYSFWKKIIADRDCYWYSQWNQAYGEWGMNTLDRIKVHVTDKNGNDVQGAQVKLYSGKTVLWEAVSDNKGQAYLFSDFDTLKRHTKPERVGVRFAQGEEKLIGGVGDYIGSDDTLEVSLDSSSYTKSKLDIMFMIDTTGSMGDELAYIQKELEDVIDRVTDRNPLDINLSVNFYRDSYDDYIVRNFDFTSDIAEQAAYLKKQRANGGGDYPEAVKEALESALEHSWRKDSEKLMFLVLDAPPHDYDMEDIPELIQQAAAMGIRIIPVASSGVDTDTEFICRSYAIATGGTYTFLTDDSGVGGSHIEPKVGAYTVEKLNDLLVRLINEYTEGMKAAQ